jgi:hypothetical protein
MYDVEKRCAAGSPTGKAARCWLVLEGHEAEVRLPLRDFLPLPESLAFSCYMDDWCGGLCERLRYFPPAQVDGVQFGRTQRDVVRPSRPAALALARRNLGDLHSTVCGNLTARGSAGRSVSS